MADDAHQEYDVCLSFAGEQRSYVSQVAKSLMDEGVRVFYDDYETASLWGKDLYEHLDYIYRRAARYCLIFVSADYARKVWTSHERKSAQSRALQENREYVLPVRFDSTELPGLRDTVGYVTASTMKPEELATLTMRKLGPFAREKYFPPEPDKLMEALGVSDDQADHAETVARSFMASLTRMSLDERRLVARIFVSGCPSELPDNVHMSLDLIRREIGFAPVQSLDLLRGIKSLGFDSALRDDTDGEGDDLVVLTWDDRTAYEDDDQAAYADAWSTLVAAKMLDVATGDYCEECAAKCIERLDFSLLSSTASASGP